jgi:nucleotide-binding universal stress UspA family protein
VTTSAHAKTAAVDWEDPGRSVVVGVDGSERNKPAVAWATHQALGTGRPLTLVYVLRDYAFPIPHHSMASDDEQGRQVLDQIETHLRTHHPDMAVRPEMASGAPVSCLLDRSVDQAMLVVGTRGLSAVARMMIGSTSIGVAGRSRVPVVVVPDSWRQADHSDEPIVVGVDPDEVHERTLRFAFVHAQHRGVGVHLVFAIDPEPELARVQALEPDFYARAKQRGAERVEDALLPYRREFPDVPVQHSEFRGHPGSALFDVATRGQMIVLGRSHSSRIGFPLGSVTRGVLHHSTVPVAVIPSR